MSVKKVDWINYGVANLGVATECSLCGKKIEGTEECTFIYMVVGETAVEYQQCKECVEAIMKYGDKLTERGSGFDPVKYQQRVYDLAMELGKVTTHDLVKMLIGEEHGED